MNDISIGIRVKPDSIIYSIIREINATKEVTIIDKVNVPVALEVPEQLKFIRNTFLDIISENGITVGCIRISEPSSQKISIERVYIEAVLQELIASSSIKKYYVGQISNMSSKLNIARDGFKKLIASNTCEWFDDWDKFKKEEKESLLAALSAFNL